MRKLIAATLFSAACTPAAPTREPAPAVATDAPTTRASGTLVATLVPTNAAGNRISGRIRLVPTARVGQYRAEIDIRGGSYQNKFPWAIRTGQCGEGGQELGNPTDFRLIETAGDGMARFNTPLRLHIPEGQTHHVAVLASPTNRSLVVSCGVLSFES
jgi:hypothetical protein